MGNLCRIYIRAMPLVDSLHMDYQLLLVDIYIWPYGSVAYILPEASKHCHTHMDSHIAHFRRIYRSDNHYCYGTRLHYNVRMGFLDSRLSNGIQLDIRLDSIQHSFHMDRGRHKG